MPDHDFVYLSVLLMQSELKLIKNIHQNWVKRFELGFLFLVVGLRRMENEFTNMIVNYLMFYFGSNLCSSWPLISIVLDSYKILAQIAIDLRSLTFY